MTKTGNVSVANILLIVLVIIIVVVIIMCLSNQSASTAAKSVGLVESKIAVKCSQCEEEPSDCGCKKKQHGYDCDCRDCKKKHKRDCDCEECCPKCLGGIGARCFIDQECASGLNCEDGQCVCPKLPGPQEINADFAKVGPAVWNLNVTWSAVPGASSYHVIIEGTSSANFMFYNGTSLTLEDVPLGGVTVTIYTVSENCGEGEPTTAGPFGIGEQCLTDQDCQFGYCNGQQCVQCVTDGQCPIGHFCQDNQCVCTKLPGPQEINADFVKISIDPAVWNLTVTWSAVPGASSYNIIIEGTPSASFMFYNGTSLTMEDVTIGEVTVTISAVSENCGEGESSTAGPFSPF
jgi:hypothetical protein